METRCVIWCVFFVIVGAVGQEKNDSYSDPTVISQEQQVYEGDRKRGLYDETYPGASAGTTVIKTQFAQDQQVYQRTLPRTGFRYALLSAIPVTGTTGPQQYYIVTRNVPIQMEYPYAIEQPPQPIYPRIPYQVKLPFERTPYQYEQPVQYYIPRRIPQIPEEVPAYQRPAIDERSVYQVAAPAVQKADASSVYYTPQYYIPQPKEVYAQPKGLPYNYVAAEPQIPLDKPIYVSILGKSS